MTRCAGERGATGGRRARPDRHSRRAGVRRAARMGGAPARPLGRHGRGPGPQEQRVLPCPDGRVAVPAGASHAARELSELRPLDGRAVGRRADLHRHRRRRGDAGLSGQLARGRGAAGGRRHAHDRADAGAMGRLCRRGRRRPRARRPRPARPRGGVTPPAEMATATLDLAADYEPAVALPARRPGDRRSRGRTGGARAGAAATTRWSPRSTAPACAPRAPRAMPAREPRPLAGHPGRAGRRAVGARARRTSRPTGAAPSVDWAAPPSAARAAALRGRPAPAGAPPRGPPGHGRGRGRRAGGLAPGPARRVGGRWRQAASPRVAGVKSEAEMAPGGARPDTTRRSVRLGARGRRRRLAGALREETVPRCPRPHSARSPAGPAASTSRR